MSTCRTRFAPSPTGFLHIGGARTALFCWLEARRRGGVFALRIEDTDRERSTPESVQAILDGMKWLELEHDEGPIYQTQRYDRYREVVQRLLDEGKAYRCWCSKERLEEVRAGQMARGEKPRYDRKCVGRTDAEPGVTPVIRFRNPDGGVVAWDDRVRGRVEISNDELDDLIIWRSDDNPTYNFVVVVDDIDMAITDVIRGDDHVGNTPRQINLYRALGAPLPSFAHLPMIHGPDGGKLSKRHGAVSVMQYRDDGYLPHALLNYIVRLGWAHGDQEIFSREEMIAAFRVDDVSRAPSRFDFDKLAWLNQHYMKTDAPESVARHLEWHLRDQGYDIAQGPRPADVVVALRDRVKTLREMAERARIWYVEIGDYDPAAAAKALVPAAAAPLTAAREALAGLAEWSPAAIDAALKSAAAALGEGIGKLAQPLRVAITGTAVSPSIDHTVYLAGRERALARIDRALAHLRA
jgi:glutamyl-tRNA synthetase